MSASCLTSGLSSGWDMGQLLDKCRFTFFVLTFLDKTRKLNGIYTFQKFRADLLLKKHFFLLSVLKTVELLNVFVKTMILACFL